MEPDKFIFKAGDRCSFGGVEGTLKRSKVTADYSFRFVPDNDLLIPVSFTEDGRLNPYHTEPLLKFISRPKKKVKRWVNLYPYPSESYDRMGVRGNIHETRQSADSMRAANCITCVEIEVEEGE